MSLNTLALRLAGLTTSCLCLATAAEAQAIFMLDSSADTVDANPGDGVCADAAGQATLRAAIQEANALGGQAVIYMQLDTLYVLTRGGTGEDMAATGDLDVTAHVSLQGRGSSVNAGGLDRAFDVLAGGRLAVNGLTVLDGHVAAESGGAFRSAGELFLAHVDILNCVATGTGASGGGVFNDGGLLSVDACSITGSSAERAGGAIEANGGTTLIDRAELSGNLAGPTPGNGGAFHLTGTGLVSVRSSRIENNTASREGGGLWNSATGNMTVDDCDVVANAANGTASDGGGGGVFNDGGFLEIRDSRIDTNVAPQGSGSGGGFFNNGGTAILSTTRLMGNSAARAGGGVEASGGQTVLWRTLLQNNTTGAAPGNGGGLHATGTSTVRFDNSIATGNTAAEEGGGLWNSSGGSMLIVRSTITNNTASGSGSDQGGGGVFNAGGALTVRNSRINQNTADGVAGSGGGVLNDQGLLEMFATDVMGNSSMRAGGGVEANVGTTSLFRVTLSGNTTGASPGNGGGLHLTGAGQVNIARGIVSSNAAAAEGGGLWNSATGTMLVTLTTISGNTAPVGPQVFNDGGTFTIDGVDVPVGP